jgi:hypothetical protein
MANTASEMVRAIDEVLAKNEQYLHLVAVPRTPLEQLLAAEDTADEDERQIRNEERMNTLRALIKFLFQSGPEPLQVLRSTFALAKAIDPAVLGDMSMADIAIICADGGRATVSARIKRIYNGKLIKAEMKDARAACQKTGDFSTPQVGNKNGKKSKNRRGQKLKTETAPGRVGM